MTGGDASATRRRATARRAGLLAAAGLSLLAGLPAVAASSHAPHHGAPGVVTVGRFRPTLERPGYSKAGNAQSLPYAQHLALAVDSKSRLLFTLDADPQDRPLNPTFVAAYHLTTLRPAAQHGAMLNGWVSTHLVDLQRGGMTVAVSDGGVDAATTAVERVVPVRGVPRATQVTPVSLGANQVVVGLATGPQPDLVFALSVAFQTPPNAVGGTSQQVPGTVQLSLIGLGHVGAIWTHQLNNCDLPVFGNITHLPAVLGYVASRRAVDIGCVPPPVPIVAGGLGAARLPVPGGVGVVNLGHNPLRPQFGFALHALPGDASTFPSGVWAPKVDRLALVLNASGGGAAFVFDGRHQAWVGSVKLSGQLPYQVGIDPLHSRFYTVTQGNDAGYGGGLILSDLNVTPVDVGHNFTQFARDPAPPADVPIKDSVAVDPSTGRLFIFYNNSATFLVARDEMPYYTPPKPANPDVNTANLAERPGVTGATYSGSAQGYGSIVRQVGGATNLVDNLDGGITPSLGPTRELNASYLDNLSIGQTGTQAGAIVAQPDNATYQQLPRQQVGAQTVGDWPYPLAACHSGDPNRTGWSADGAEVACTDSAASAAVTSGSSSASYATGAGGSNGAAASVVSVAGSTLAATSSRDSKRGVVTKVTSIARGITLLGGLLRIGEVSTTAQAHAHGRPHTAGSTFSRTLQDVTLGGKPLCSTNCDPATVAQQVNTALAGHVLISFPIPDRSLARGTPGGYQAVVHRDAYSAVDERTLNDQSPNRLEVPGMEATIFEDGLQPSRTVVYLAGVEAEAHYGIYRLSQLGVTPQGSTNAPGGNAPGAPGVLGGPTVTSPSGDVAGAPTVAAPTDLGGLLHHGWKLLLAGAGDVIRLLGVWLVLLAPVYLSARRWLLTRRHEVTHV